MSVVARVLVSALAAISITSCAPAHAQSHAAANRPATSSDWGLLPPMHPDYSAVPSWSSAGQDDLYTDAANLTFGVTLDLAITAAPVFRYTEPTWSEAKSFAAALHATPEVDTVPNGRSWSFGNNDYRVVVVHTDEARGMGPAFLIFPALDLTVEPVSAGPEQRSLLFLTAHQLLPAWPYIVSTRAGETQSSAVFERELMVPGYGLASMVDLTGLRCGLAVSFDGDRLLAVDGFFPLPLESRDYPILSPAEAYGSAYPSPRPAPPGSPTVKLTHAELVYAVVPAGDEFGFYEPAYLFSGTFQMKGRTYVKQVLAPALDPPAGG